LNPNPTLQNAAKFTTPRRLVKDDLARTVLAFLRVFDTTVDDTKIDAGKENILMETLQYGVANFIVLAGGCPGFYRSLRPSGSSGLHGTF
jgi:hypothetical protein